MADVDESSWDGNKAMGACETAADYRSICAGEKTVGETDERQHWALPHHYLGKPPNAAGVRNALSRLPQTKGLKNEAAARSHLEAHMSTISEGASANGRAEYPKDDLIRMVGAVKRPNVYTAPSTRSVSLLGEPNVMIGYASVFNGWADIQDWEGTFRERFLPGSFDKTLRESRDKVKVMFNHGFDAWVGENLLGVPRKMDPDAEGLWIEVPLLDTDYNRDRIRPQLESGALDGQSIRFSVVQEAWNFDTEDNVPERSIAEARLFEFGPVTWPAYEATTAGVRTRAQFELWRSKAEAAPPTDEGRGTDEAAAPPDEGRDTSALTDERLRVANVRADLERQKEEMERYVKHG